MSIKQVSIDIYTLLSNLFYSSLFSLCFSIPIGLAQEYQWPTDASQLMTSSFGEYRAGHFHAGIDIKTWGQSGYQVFAIEKGYINRIRVSPYGYGRSIYLLLDNGLNVVYAHLSKFSESIEKLIKEEQKKQRKFSIDKIFLPGQLPVEKGELVGFTGRSGTRDPHLHFEVRNNDDQPINPFLIGYVIDDQIPPIVNGIAVTPLSYGSHVDADFQPSIYSVQKDKNGLYRLIETVQAWGQIGLSVSTFDQANEASNSFAVYRIRFYVDEQPTFTIQYDYFPYDITQQIELDRDYRLNQWGWGLFQKLYCDIGNELPFYEPLSTGAGTLSCWNEKENQLHSQKPVPINSQYLNGSLNLEKGYHSIRIEISDYFENLTTVVGTLQMIPLSEMDSVTVPLKYLPEIEIVETDSIPGIKLEKEFMDDLIRLCVKSDHPLQTYPLLYIQRNNGIKTPVVLLKKSDQTFIGSTPLYPDSDGQITTELHTISQQGIKYVMHDTMETFTIIPNQTGSMLSDDRTFRVIFPKGSVYRPILGSYQRKLSSHPDCAIDHDYIVYPQDIPLKSSVRVIIDIPPNLHDVDKLGIYQIGKNGSASFLGNIWENSALSATTGSLSCFTVLSDTVPPEIHFIRPVPDAHIRDQTPLISVGFRDTLSGIYGENHYQFYLDSMQLIVEYDPINNLGFHQ
ncbi:M23 family metallopeptidase, partial [bacterium]|nr:M23 family metallopeptidase [bacterium]